MSYEELQRAVALFEKAKGLCLSFLCKDYCSMS